MKPQYIHEIPPEWECTAAIFTALGDTQRQRLLLAFEPGERLTVSQLTEASPLARPTVSHHLKVLREAGILSCEKKGKEVFYWINHSTVATALKSVLDYLTP